MYNIAQTILEHFRFVVACLEEKTLNQVIEACPEDKALLEQLAPYLDTYGDEPVIDFIEHYFTVEWIFDDKPDYMVSNKIVRGEVRGPGTLDAFFRAVLRRGYEIEEHQSIQNDVLDETVTTKCARA